MNAEVRITKLHLTVGIGMVPTVAIEANGAFHTECAADSSEPADVYELVTRAVNAAVAVENVSVLTRSTTTLKKTVGANGQWREVLRDRVTVRLRAGSYTTRNIGGEANDPVWAFLRAYVAALNYLFRQTDVARSIVLSGE